jgi:hypothetical protein
VEINTPPSPWLRLSSSTELRNVLAREIGHILRGEQNSGANSVGRLTSNALERRGLIDIQALNDNVPIQMASGSFTDISQPHFDFDWAAGDHRKRYRGSDWFKLHPSALIYANLTLGLGRLPPQFHDLVVSQGRIDDGSGCCNAATRRNHLLYVGIGLLFCFSLLFYIIWKPYFRLYLPVFFVVLLITFGGGSYCVEQISQYFLNRYQPLESLPAAR